VRPAASATQRIFPGLADVWQWARAHGIFLAGSTACRFCSCAGQTPDACITQVSQPAIAAARVRVGRLLINYDHVTAGAGCGTAGTGLLSYTFSGALPISIRPRTDSGSVYVQRSNTSDFPNVELQCDVAGRPIGRRSSPRNVSKYFRPRWWRWRGGFADTGYLRRVDRYNRKRTASEFFRADLCQPGV